MGSYSFFVGIGVKLITYIYLYNYYIHCYVYIIKNKCINFTVKNEFVLTLIYHKLDNVYWYTIGLNM